MALGEEFLLLMTVAMIAILYDKSDKFRYFAKFTAFILLSLFFATVFIPLMVFKPKDYRNALYPAWGARQVSKLLGLKWIVKGKENIIQDSGCVVLINHQSCLDLLVLAELWPIMERCTVISKIEIFYLWPFGLACWLWGTVFIDRTSGDRAQLAVNTAASTINSNKAKICMFPEGTRHGGETLLPFKKGAFHIAIASQAPIQPVVVSRYDFLDTASHVFNSGVNTIHILPKIETSGKSKGDIEQLMQETYEVMSREYKALSKSC